MKATYYLRPRLRPPLRRPRLRICPLRPETILECLRPRAMVGTLSRGSKNQKAPNDVIIRGRHGSLPVEGHCGISS